MFDFSSDSLYAPSTSISSNSGMLYVYSLISNSFPSNTAHLHHEHVPITVTYILTTTMTMTLMFPLLYSPSVKVRSAMKLQWQPDIRSRYAENAPRLSEREHPLDILSAWLRLGLIECALGVLVPHTEREFSERVETLLYDCIQLTPGQGVVGERVVHTEVHAEIQGSECGSM
jgi:hypothetical protein